MGDGNVAEWIKVIDFMLSLDVEKIIPGHGPVSTKKDLIDMKQYLLAFDKMAKELTAKSDNLEYIVTEMKKSLPHKTQLNSIISSNIQMKYLKKNK